MGERSVRFGQMLDQAVMRVCANKRHAKGKVIRDLMSALCYESSTYYSWTKGGLPGNQDTREALARLLFEWGGLDCDTLPDFLRHAYIDNPDPILAELCAGPGSGNPGPALDPGPAPFWFGNGIQHPRQFFGREKLLTEIFRLWRNGALLSGAIIGNRRSGKTSILEYVRMISAHPSGLRAGQRSDWLPQGPPPQWVFVDFQEPGNRRQSILFETILTRLRVPVPENCTQIAFNRIIAEQLRQPVVLLLDEFDKALTAGDSELDQDFWEGMRALVRKSRGKLAFLVASLSKPDELALHEGITSPFFNIFLCLNRCQKLGPFDEREARELIDSAPIPFPEADKTWILQHSGGWPVKLQICCFHRLAALEEGRRDDSWKADAQADIDRFDPGEEA